MPKTDQSVVNEFGLNDRQVQFIQNHFSGDYRTQAAAYIAAGYSSRGAEVAACKLLKIAKSQKYLLHLRRLAHDAMVNRYLAEADGMIDVLTQIAKATENPPQTRVSAAKALLDGASTSYKSGVQDEQMQVLEERLEQLQELKIDHQTINQKNRHGRGHYPSNDVRATASARSPQDRAAAAGVEPGDRRGASGMGDRGSGA